MLLFYENATGVLTITWEDNIAIVGKPLAYSIYIPVAILVLYIPVVIFDGIICYKKNLVRNFEKLTKQTELLQKA